MMRTLSLASLILLGACSGAPAEADGRNQAMPARTQTAPTTAEAPSPAAVPSPAAQAEEAGIPTAFHGVWSAPGTDCAPRSDGRLEVSADTLRYSDAIGRLRDRQLDGPTKARLDLAMAGEGQEWRELEEIELLEGGKRLRIIATGQEAGEETDVTYTRCEGAK